jgi:hypothetical protein
MIVAGVACALLVAVIALIVERDRRVFSTKPPSRLRPSGATGLLGAPLPSEAKLMERRTSAEVYSVSASQTDILTFFEQAMVAQGWKRDEELDTQSSRSFKKGDVELLVVAGVASKTFSLSMPPPPSAP